MTAYRFRLATVARVRAVQEGVAAQRLALAARDRHLADEARAAAGAALAGYGGVTGTVTVAEVVWGQEQAGRLADEVALRTERAAEAAALAEEARLAWLSARRRAAVLERLDARQFERWRLEEDRSDAKVLDDLATVRFLRAGGGS